MTPVYEEFVSFDNFRLAWDRVRYFDRPDSRDWIGLKIFAANRDHNLEILRQSVAEHTFEPSWPEIKYMPKPSMTLRPMAMLSICDRVIFQAIGNVIASKGRAKLATIANKQSFANVLAGNNEKALFVHWKHQYHLFQQKYLELVQDGNVWLAETDAAAFYETIDHSILFEILLDEGFLDEDTLESLRRYLPIWSSVRSNKLTPRGVPQGCLTSDLLANVYLYQFDQEMAVQEYFYLRYVDDIRLLAKTKDAVQRGLIHVDTSIKSIGLLLQTKKTIVRQISDINEESDRLAAQLSEIDNRLRDPEEQAKRIIRDPLLVFPVMSAVHVIDEEDIPPSTEDKPDVNSDLLEDLPHDYRREFLAAIEETYQELIRSAQQELKILFWKSLKSIEHKDNDPFAERHLRFALHRLEPDDEITKAVLPHFVDRPWLSEVIALYLRKCKLDFEAISFISKVISEHDVYDSIIALAVRLLIQKEVPIRHHQALLRRWLIEDKRHWSLVEASALALGESADNLSALLKGFSSQSPSVRRMALIQSLRLAENKSMTIHIASNILHDSSPDVANTLLYLLYNEWGLTLTDILPNSNIPIPEHYLQFAASYDASLPSPQADYVRHVFAKSYQVQCSGDLNFRVFLGTEYERTVKFLWQAENSFLSNPSRYVAQLDLFHEEMLYPIMVDKLGVKSTREELAKVELANRIEMLQSGKRELATFSGAIAACRRLRANPETHSRFHRELKHTNPVTWRERDSLKQKLRGGYQELADWIQAGCL